MNRNDNPMNNNELILIEYIHFIFGITTYKCYTCIYNLQVIDNVRVFICIDNVGKFKVAILHS